MPKIKKSRVGFVLDMTPLVDIAFLLLTFFMFTAKFKSDAENEQKFVIERPKSSADTSKLPENNLVIVKIGIDSVTSDTAYYFEIANEKDRRAVLDEVQDLLPPEMQGKSQIKADLKLLERLVLLARSANPKAKFAVDADRRIRFQWIEDLMEVFRKSRATVFNFVTDKEGGM